MKVLTHMAVSTDTDRIEEILTRSIAKVYPSKAALKARLANGRQLTFYMGIDPTADYVHLGHSTNYLLLERLHAMGHKIIVLVGDFTAMIGDPSDKTSMRVQLTKEQVQENLKTFKAQIGKILNFNDTENPIEFKYNSAWLAKLTFHDSVELASNFTVQQMIERDAFEKRIKDNKPLFVHEFFYPLMQGYDSVAMEVDGEIGGTDQTFNMLAGRTLLKRYKNKEKFVLATTLLENPITKEKLMSKSLGTGIALNEQPNDMFIKVMRLPDEALLQCFIDCTRLSLAEINELADSLKNGANPRDIKLQLARVITQMYHGKQAASDAEAYWISQVSKKEDNQAYPDLHVTKFENIVDAIASTGVVASKSQIRRLFNEGAVRIGDRKITLEYTSFSNGDVLSIGKKHKFTIKTNT